MPKLPDREQPDLNHEAQPRPAGLSIITIFDLSDKTDQQGRLLLEGSAPEEVKEGRLLKEGVPTYLRPSRIQGSRFGRPTNVEAMKSYKQDEAQILLAMQTISTECRTIDPSIGSTVNGLRKLAEVCRTLPVYLFHRADAPFATHGALPSYIANIFKAAQGIKAATDHMEFYGMGEMEITADAIMQYAEGNGLLVGEGTGEGCAAPPKPMRDALNALLLPATVRDERTLADIGDMRKVLTLSDVSGTYRSINQVYGKTAQSLNEQMAELSGALSRDELTENDVFRQIDAGFRSYEATKTVVYQRLPILQTQANQLLGRRTDAPMPEREDIEATVTSPYRLLYDLFPYYLGE